MMQFPTVLWQGMPLFRKMLHEMLHGDENSVETSRKSYEKRATIFIVTLYFFKLNGGERGI